MTSVIIGSGPAGVCAAEAIRARRPDEPVTMVSKDRLPAGSPVMLTYWVSGKYDARRLYFRDAAWADKYRITLKPGAEVVRVEPTAGRLVLASGEALSYDRLLIASGTSAVALPFAGGDSQGVGFFRHLHDAQAFVQGAADVKRVAIIGAGLIGLKLACHLIETGIGVILLEKESRLAARIFDAATSRRVAATLREHGIGVETGVEVQAILSRGRRASGIRLKDGRTYDCERVVQAVGVQPNVGFLQDSGIELQPGVVVDDRMQTNQPGIYAAGDVTVTADSVTGERFSNATWPAAVRQGTVAGNNMAGASRRYRHNFPVNALDLFDLRIMAAGHPLLVRTEGVEVAIEETSAFYRRLVARSGRLVGFILVGETAGAGILLNAIKSKKKIDSLTAAGAFSLQRSVPANLGYRREHSRSIVGME